MLPKSARKLLFCIRRGALFTDLQTEHLWFCLICLCKSGFRCILQNSNTPVPVNYRAMSVAELRERHVAATAKVNALRERMKDKRRQLLDTDVATYASNNGRTPISFSFTDLVCCRTVQGHTGKVGVQSIGAQRVKNECVSFRAFCEQRNREGYLLVLDRTNWRTNMLTSLLVPYIFLNLPSLIFNIFRGEIGKWIAFVAVVLRLFFPRHFPDWLEMPGSLILLLVVTPHLIVEIRGWWIGVIISLIIGAYLLQEHIRKNGGFRNAFAERRGVSNTIGIILLFISPLWELIKLVL